MMPPVFAHCLGQFHVTINPDHGREPRTVRFATDRAAALLAYLLEQPEKTHRRAYLAYLIWPERPEKLARQNLRQTLTRLRKAVEPYEIIESDYQTVRLNTAVIHSDLATFRHHLAQGQWAQAAACYQGEFLHSFQLSHNPAFDEWLLLTREAWQRQAKEVLTTLVSQAQQTSAWPEVVTYAQRYIQLEPWDEAMHRTLLTAWARSHQKAEAWQHYQRYVM